MTDLHGRGDRLPRPVRRLLDGATDPGNDHELERILRVVAIGAAAFLGTVLSLAIAFALLGAVSSLVLPLLFAAVLAVVLRPAAGWLRARGVPRGVASLTIVLGLAATAALTLGLVVGAIGSQTERLGTVVDRAVDDLKREADVRGVDPDLVDSTRSAGEEGQHLAANGLLGLAGWAIGGATAVAAGVILGAMIMYYLLADGDLIRAWITARVPPRWQPGSEAIAEDAIVTLRAYAKARTMLAAVVATVISAGAMLLGAPLVGTIFVVNLIGGYIPYLGAFISGAIAVLLVIGGSGLGSGLAMLAMVLAANLALENLLEPKVMSRELSLHPLAVLLVTTAGGIIAGPTGLVLAVPFTVIVSNALARLRPTESS